MGSVKGKTTFEIEDIPEAMTAARRWVNWRAVERDGRWTKVPIDPETGGAASSTDPSTWGSFMDAVEVANGDVALGIGFMLGDGWLGIDFDNLDAPESKALREFVWDWGRDCGTYMEWSPSKTGVHAIFRNVELPEWSQNRRGPVEVYQKARFFTVTGDRLFTDRDVNDAQGAVDEVCEKYLRKPEPAKPSNTAPIPSSTAGDPSAADWAYCCDLAARGFRAEEMTARLVEKMRGEGRAEKAARADYIERTVRGALAAAPASEATVEPLSAISLAALLEEHPVRTPYLIEGVLRRGEVACIIAPPKCAKSFLLADLALACATGNRWHGHWNVTEGRVCLVDNELTRNEMAHRMREVMRAKGISVPRIVDKIDLISLRETSLSAESVLEQLEGLGKYDLVIFDALYRFLEKGMDENSNADMTVLLRAFSRYASRTTACVVLVHHTAKGNQAGKESIDAGSGAGALGRAVDTHIVLFKHEEEDVFVEQMNTRSSKRPGKLAIRWEYPTFADTMVGDLEALHGSPKSKKKATE
jgi:hypothetical protein